MKPRWKWSRGGETASPAKDRVKERKERFEGMLQFVTKAGGWITSEPGLPVVTLQCLPGSALPADLKELGFKLTDAGETERIISGSITETVLIEGSTAVRTVRHAGIVPVKVWTFSI